jgi:hypothetical protein
MLLVFYVKKTNPEIRKLICVLYRSAGIPAALALKRRRASPYGERAAPA